MADRRYGHLKEYQPFNLGHYPGLVVVHRGPLPGGCSSCTIDPALAPGSHSAMDRLRGGLMRSRLPGGAPVPAEFLPKHPLGNVS